MIRASFSEDVPNQARFRTASSAFSCSITLPFAASSLAWARMIAFNASGSEGSESVRMLLILRAMRWTGSAFRLRRQSICQAMRCGGALQDGRRQSMPSHSIASCAAVSRAVPSARDGQGKRPRSRTL